jgi:hypothetical protein
MFYVLFVFYVSTGMTFARNQYDTQDTNCDDLATSTAWDGSQGLNEDGTYILKWKLSSDQSSITVMTSITGSSPQWIGLGVSEVGHMLGSDIVTVLYNTSPVLTDNWVDWYAYDPSVGYPSSLYPTPDTYNNWLLSCASKSSGVLMTIMSRALDTGDGQDRAIVSGPNHIIWAWGTTPYVSHHLSENRGSSSVTFFGNPPPSYPTDADGSTQLLFNSNFQTPDPALSTQYLCQVCPLALIP